MYYIICYNDKPKEMAMHHGTISVELSMNTQDESSDHAQSCVEPHDEPPGPDKTVG